MFFFTKIIENFIRLQILQFYLLKSAFYFTILINEEVLELPQKIVILYVLKKPL